VSASQLGYNRAVEKAAKRRGLFPLAAIMAFLVTAPAVVEASLPRLTVDPVADYRPPIPIAEILALEEPSSHYQSPAFTLGLAETRVWASATKIGPRDWLEELVSRRNHQGYTLFGFQIVAGFFVDPYGVPAVYTDPTELPDPGTADYDSVAVAGNTLGGRFPGGQNLLFQGLWADPVTGHSYARARWYDARNASWLSEDPKGDVDSANHYAFVAWGPHSALDPYGTSVYGAIVEKVTKKKLKKTLYKKFYDRLKKAGISKLYQVHHVVGQKFGKEYYDFFADIGFDIDDAKNLVALPTKKGKKKKGKHSGRSGHQGRHLKAYEERTRNMVQNVYERYAAKDIDAATAREMLEAFREDTMEKLLDGKIKLQHWDDEAATAFNKGTAIVVPSLLGVGVVAESAVAAEVESKMEQYRSDAKEMIEEIKNQPDCFVMPLTANYYTRDNGAVISFLGRQVDNWFNPIQDGIDITEEFYIAAYIENRINEESKTMEERQQEERERLQKQLEALRGLPVIQ
jgi:RHS repeat-associated protein